MSDLPSRWMNWKNVKCMILFVCCYKSVPAFANQWPLTDQQLCLRREQQEAWLLLLSNGIRGCLLLSNGIRCCLKLLYIHANCCFLLIVRHKENAIALIFVEPFAQQLTYNYRVNTQCIQCTVYSKPCYI